MLKSFLWLLVALVGVLLIAVIILLIRHSAVINRLNRGLSNTNIRLEHEVVGIGFYVRIIAYILLVACVGVAIHYMAIELPRVLNNQYTNSHIDNLGVDYLGLIVAMFAIIVTLLVGWQIYATIRARQELNEARDEIGKRFGSNLTKIEECCKERGEQIDSIIASRENFLERLTKVETYCNNRKDELKDLICKVNDSFDLASAINENYIADIYNDMLLPDSELPIEYRYLSHRIQALIHFSKLEKIEGCNLIVNNTIQTIKNIQQITMGAKWRTDLIEDYLRVKHSDKIVDYLELKELLENIKITEATVKNKSKRTRTVRLKKSTLIKNKHSGNIAAAKDSKD